MASRMVEHWALTMIDGAPPQAVARPAPLKRADHWGAALLDAPPQAANGNADAAAGSPFVHYWPATGEKHRAVWSASPVVLPG